MSRGPLYLPATYSDIPYMAVCAGRTPYGMHAGILFRHSRDDRIRLLDLPIDGRVNADFVENAPCRLAWAIPDLDEFELRDLAAFCEKLADTTPQLDYSFKFIEGTELVAAGHTFTLANANGLTCATFVMAVFHSQKIPLIDIPSWQHRPADREWQRRLVDRITRDGVGAYGLTAGQLGNMQTEIGCLRFRPEEVVGAGLCGSHPTHWDHAMPAGEDVKRWIKATEDLLS